MNALQDQIRERGAMNQLLSDQAQVEISAGVKKILGVYAIGNWQSEPYHQHQNFAENRYETVRGMLITTWIDLEFHQKLG